MEHRETDHKNLIRHLHLGGFHTVEGEDGSSVRGRHALSEVKEPGRVLQPVLIGEHLLVPGRIFCKGCIGNPFIEFHLELTLNEYT